MSNSDVSDLPVSCLEEIFFKLSIRNRLRCGRVCRRWAEVLTFIDLRHLNIFHLPLVKIPLKVGIINGLSLAPHSVILDALNSILPRTSHNLTSITFHSHQCWWEATFDQFQLISEFCPNLVSLRLSNCDFRLVCEAHLLELINQMGNLRSFALFYSLNFIRLVEKNSFAREFFALNWPLLERLEMSTDVDFRSESVEFDEEISKLTQLKYLSLNGSALRSDSASFIQLNQICVSCVDLTELRLNFAHVCWPRLHDIVHLRHLERLEIRGDKLTDSNLLQMGQIASLTQLFLECEKVTSVGVAHLMRNCPQLTSLHLLRTQISAEIFQLIGECPNLRQFHLCHISLEIAAGLQLLLTERLRRGNATQLAIHTSLSYHEDVLQLLQHTNVSCGFCYFQPH